ncbi:MAG: iron-sulfur cluster insertion protein ErpA [Proteobacteria bacterium]|nr:iron-sulfur cluster insertion protein ErpA [Pseudomonadota bacterium]
MDTSPAIEDITISDSAAKRISELVAGEGSAGLMLRVSISGGGCSGFQYGFSLDGTRNDDDLLFERNGVKVVVDQVSLDYIKGAELDFIKEMIGSYFSLKNPNASSTCGCGSSFAI